MVHKLPGSIFRRCSTQRNFGSDQMLANASNRRDSTVTVGNRTCQILITRVSHELVRIIVCTAFSTLYKRMENILLYFHRK